MHPDKKTASHSRTTPYHKTLGAITNDTRMTREELFSSIKTGIKSNKDSIEFKWCSDIRELKSIAVKVYEHENHLSLDLGIIEVFENIKLNYVTDSNNDFKLKGIRGTYAHYSDAKELTNKLIDTIGKPDQFTDVQEHLFAHWSDNNVVVQVCTRDHHGGPWFEYSISKKNCT